MTTGTQASLARLPSANGGAAAVEFAIVLPILMTFVVAIIQYGGMLIAFDRMHAAVASGAVYVMRGGTSTTGLHDLTVAAWPSKPSDAAVAVSQTCTCQGVGASCSTVCSDNTYPQKFTSITATGTFTGLWGSKPMSSTQVVRTQ